MILATLVQKAIKVIQVQQDTQDQKVISVTQDQKAI